MNTHINRLLSVAVALVGLTTIPNLTSAQEVFEPHNRERGELSPGTQAPTRADLMRAIDSAPTGTLIALLEYGERVECHACVAPLTQNLLESGDAEVRRISAWWLRRRPFAVGAVMRTMRETLEGSTDAVRRARAASALGELLDPHALSPLRVAAMEDAEASVRTAAVSALGRLNHPGGNAVIGAALGDADVNVRRAAIDTVLTVNFFRENDALLGALGDSDVMVRMRAARIIGELRVDSAVPALVALLRGDESIEVRQAAAFGLGRINGEEARGALRTAMEEESSPRVLDAVGIALQMRRR